MRNVPNESNMRLVLANGPIQGIHLLLRDIRRVRRQDVWVRPPALSCLPAQHLLQETLRKDIPLQNLKRISPSLRLPVLFNELDPIRDGVFPRELDCFCQNVDSGCSNRSSR